jgi:hypothetical protein
MDKDVEAATNLAIEAQLLLLFGEGSRYSGSASKTTAERRRTLRAILAELGRYMEANIDTDESHWATLRYGLNIAGDALRCADFWPGYCAGLAHIAIALLGHFPDHSRKGPGRPKKDRYRLDSNRSVAWSQTPQQRVNTLFFPVDFGAPEGPASPRARYLECCRDTGSQASARDRLRWYRKKYPSGYTQFF